MKSSERPDYFRRRAFFVAFFVAFLRAFLRFAMTEYSSVEPRYGSSVPR